MHNVRLFYVLLLVVMLFAPVPKSMAESLSDRAQTLIALLQKKYENTTDITADFRQETFAAGSSEGLKAEGRVYFSRPHRMRWEYSTPEPQLIVTSGQEVYVYEKEANQVMILPRNQLLSTEISKAFFFGKGDIKRYFKVENPQKDQPEAQWTLKLIPRDPVPQVCAIWIVLDPDTHLIREMWLEDLLGGKTHLVFSNAKVNKGLSDDLFQFAPPQGAEIYRADGSEG